MSTVLKVVGAITLIFIVGFVGMCGVATVVVVNDPDVQESFQELEVIVDEMDAPPIITLAEFNQIQTGMALSQVINIIGQAGETMSENNIAGIQTAMYGWTNGDFSNANVMIQDGKLISKSQFGLK